MFVLCRLRLIRLNAIYARVSVCLCTMCVCVCVHLSTRLIKCLSLAFVPSYSFSFHFVHFVPLVALRLVRFPFVFPNCLAWMQLKLLLILYCVLYMYCVCYSSCLFSCSFIQFDFVVIFCQLWLPYSNQLNWAEIRTNDRKMINWSNSCSQETRNEYLRHFRSEKKRNNKRK